MSKDPEEARKESTQKALGAYKDIAGVRKEVEKKVNFSRAQKKAAERREAAKKDGKDKK